MMSLGFFENIWFSEGILLHSVLRTRHPSPVGLSLAFYLVFYRNACLLESKLGNLWSKLNSLEYCYTEKTVVLCTRRYFWNSLFQTLAPGNVMYTYC